MKKYLAAKSKTFFVSMYNLVLGKLSQDIGFARSVKSLISTAAYVEQHMLDTPSVDKILRVHDIAIEQITIKNGIVMEFGVFTGTTINHIAKKLKATRVYGFDSFEGLPEYWRDGFQKGAFSLQQLPRVEENVTLIKGWFDKTLPEFKLDNRQIAYLHIDCDLYSSTKTIFQYLKDSIVKDTVIVFDEYFNYPGWQEGEFKAFKEFIRDTGKEYKYLTYNSKHEQVAVIITKG